MNHDHETCESVLSMSDLEEAIDHYYHTPPPTRSPLGYPLAEGIIVDAAYRVRAALSDEATERAALAFHKTWTRRGLGRGIDDNDLAQFHADRLAACRAAVAAALNVSTGA